MRSARAPRSHGGKEIDGHADEPERQRAAPKRARIRRALTLGGHGSPPCAATFRLACRLATSESVCLALRRLRETHDLARGFGGEQTLELPLVLVAKLARVEAVLERADQLLGERDLALVGSAIRVGAHGSDLHDLLRVAQRIEQQIPAARLQRADVALVAQHPVRDADRVALLERIGQREVALLVAVGPQVVRPIEPALVDGARRDDLLDADEPRRLRCQRGLLLLGQQHVDAAIDGDRFLDLLAGDTGSLGLGIDHLLLDGRVVGRMQQAEMHLRVLHRRV